MGLPDFRKNKGIDCEEYEAPDGGWGWMVAVGVAALFVSNNVSYFNARAAELGLVLTLRSLTLYIYGAPILDVSRSHTTTQHSR